MVANQKTGIRKVYEDMLTAKGLEAAVQEAVRAATDYGTEQLAHGETKEKIKQRNGAGALGKKRKFVPLKEKAAALYAEMKAQLGRNPPLTVFKDELEKRYPNESWPRKKRKSEEKKGEKKVVDPLWDTGGVEDWWKAMNQNKPF